MINPLTLDFLERLAYGVAKQFGSNCEVTVHDLTSENKDSTIIAIENGHVTNRKKGDGPSQVVLEALKKDPKDLNDHLDYLTKTDDGRMLKSSSVFIRDEKDQVVGVFGINYDITGLMVFDNALHSLIGNRDSKKPERITTNVGDLLDELIEQSVTFVGKPVGMMTRDDKVRAVQFLNNAGALLITKSGDKIASYFGISKYSLYSYLDQNDSE
ncbi:MAG: helix-turn-helix transcriptional regulator [Eubacteriaceae bacterium]